MLNTSKKTGFLFFTNKQKTFKREPLPGGKMLSIIAFIMACSDAEPEQQANDELPKTQAAKKPANPPAQQAVTEVKEETPDGNFYCYKTEQSTFAIWPVPNNEMGEVYYDFWPAGTPCKYQKEKTSERQATSVRFVGSAAGQHLPRQ